MGSLQLAVVSLGWLASGLGFAVATAGTPGPNNAMLTSSGSLWGFRRTIPHMLGISIGFPIMLIAVAAGGGSLLIAHPTALSVLRWLGGAYLLYLAWRIATARPAAKEDEKVVDAESARTRRRPLSFIQAALFQWVNPKAWLITISALATLTSVAQRPSFARALLLAGVFLVVTLPVTAFWTSVGVGVARVAKTQQTLRRFNLVMAALLVASVVSVLVGIG